MKYPTISGDAETQKRYVDMVKSGSGHKLAEMLALQKPPMSRDTYSPMHPRRGRGKGYGKK